MPKSPPTPCRNPGCGTLVEKPGFCDKHKKESRKQYDNRRGSSTQRGYNYRWQQARERYLKSHPLCVLCQENGEIVYAEVVDHIKPHRGDFQLMWDESNWQPLCKQCHDGYKQRLEKSGRLSGCNQDGIPIDSNHH